MAAEREGVELENAEVALVASLARHLAFAPVAFAVTEGPQHVVRYANTAFRSLQSAGQIFISEPPADVENPGTDLSPLLDRAFGQGETIRDEVLAAPEGRSRWNCTVWPIATESVVPEGLVLEVRDAAYVEGAMARQRAIAERLLLGALREHDDAKQAHAAGRRAEFLAAASHDLSRSLDQDATRAIVRQSALPREGTWCISRYSRSRMARFTGLPSSIPIREASARYGRSADRLYPKPDDPKDVLNLTRLAGREPLVITPESESDLIAAVHGPENLAILRELGFGALLVVPLVVRDTVPLRHHHLRYTRRPARFIHIEEISLTASDLANR